MYLLCICCPEKVMFLLSRGAGVIVVQRRWCIFLSREGDVFVVYLLSREGGVSVVERRWFICCPENVVYLLSREGGVYVV